MQKNCSFPQARKHCLNGGAGTDCDWDNKQNGTKKKESRGGKETKKGKEVRVKEDNEEGKSYGFLKRTYATV